MKQLSVFIENREGRLEDVLNLLKEKNMIVSDPQKGREALKENGFSATLNDVVAVTLPHKVGALQEILHVLCKESLNVEYMYALCTKTDEAAIVIKPSDPKKAEEVLRAAGVHFFAL